MSALADRFAAAAVRRPLIEERQLELDRLLERVDAFEDLPGWWQAALLAAEGERPAKAPGHCCGHH